MVKTVLTCMFLCLWIAVADAQNIQRETGIRLGWGGGVSHKTSHPGGWMWEGFAGARFGGVSLGLILGRESPLGETGIKGEWGGGLRLGLHDRYNHIGESHANKPVHLNPGIILSAGLTYELKRLPFNLGVSYLPSFVFYSERVFEGENIHLVMRYRWD